MGGQEDLIKALSVAEGLLNDFALVLHRGRELEDTLLDPDVRWYLERSQEVMFRALYLNAQGGMLCPSAVGELLFEGPAGSSSGPVPPALQRYLQARLSRPFR